jgi:hypothetical protein
LSCCANEKAVKDTFMYNTYHTVLIALIWTYLKIKFDTLCNAHHAYFSGYKIRI